MIAMDSAIIAKLTTRYKASPCWILRIILPGGSKWFSSTAIVNPAILWQSKITSITDITRTMTANHSATSGEVSVSIDDTDGTLRDLIKQNTFFKAPAELSLTFVNEDGTQLTNGSSAVSANIFTGVLKVPLEWREDSRIITVTIESSLNTSKTISKPDPVTFGSNESLSSQGEWPVAIGCAIWTSDIFLERMQTYVVNADTYITGYPVVVNTTPNVVGAPDGTKGIRAVSTIGDWEQVFDYSFDKTFSAAGPRLTNGASPATLKQGEILRLAFVSTAHKSFWFKCLMNRYTGQYFNATYGVPPGYNFSMMLHYLQDDKHEALIMTGSPAGLGLTNATYEGYKIGTADLPGATNQYCGLRINFDPIMLESWYRSIDVKEFRDIIFYTTNSLRIRHVLREFLEMFCGASCGTSLTSTTYDSIYPTNQVSDIGLMTETGQDAFKVAEQFCLELGVTIRQNGSGLIEMRPAKDTTVDFTINYSYVKLGSIVISETDQDAVYTMFTLYANVAKVYDARRNPDGIEISTTDMSFTYSNNVSTYGTIEYPPIEAVAAAYIRNININALKHFGYRKSNRWLNVELTLIRVGVRIEVFDIVQLDLPNEIPLASGTVRGRVISVSTSPESILTKLKIEVAIKAGSANSSGLYTEDAAYWNGPA